LIVRTGPQATEARLLAERRYPIAAQQGRQQEALVYNEPAQDWPTLEESMLKFKLRTDADPAD
jgi:hypothetical protein